MRRAILVVCVLALLGCTREVAPLRVTKLDGTPVTVEAFRSSVPAVVNFWASWCVYCRKELPLLDSASKRYPEVHFIGVNLGEPPRMARTFWTELRLSFSSVLDPYGDLKKEFDVFARPTTLFINAQGDVVSRHNGPLTAVELELRMQELTENVQWQSERVSSTCDDAGNCHK